jgi:protein arginine kinase activator
MKCHRCETRDAIYRCTKIPRDSKEPVTRELCLECARIESNAIAKSAPKHDINEILEELLKSQIASEGGDHAAPIIPDVPPCPECGLEFAAYKATLMLGCAACYVSFGEHLAEDIRKLQGTDIHVGAPPQVREKLLDRQSRLTAMRGELADCIENEDFERATFLRDQIKALLAEDVVEQQAKATGEEPES